MDDHVSKINARLHDTSLRALVPNVGGKGWLHSRADIEYGPISKCDTAGGLQAPGFLSMWQVARAFNLCISSAVFEIVIWKIPISSPMAII